MLRCWGVTVLGCWGIGVLGCWGVGVLRYWGVGVLGCYGIESLQTFPAVIPQHRNTVAPSLPLILLISDEIDHLVVVHGNEYSAGAGAVGGDFAFDEQRVF